jgi:hypothetical protein
MAIQAALLTAVQDAVVDAAVTVTLPVAAAAPSVTLTGLRENAAAAWVTVSETPAMAIEPDRLVVAEFAATE